MVVLYRLTGKSSRDVPHLLILEARFYEDLADELHKGAAAALARAAATPERLSALAMAIEAMDEGQVRYDGFVVLGCVIRGETSHYDIVAGESARALMDLAVDEALALGYGILTVESGEQAWRRARVDDLDKGGGAASAALAMIALRDRFGRGK